MGMRSEYTNSLEIFSDIEEFKRFESSYFESGKKKLFNPCIFITKFERARVLGLRALQISNGGSIYVKLEGEVDPLQIALKEYREKKIPFKLRRYSPNGNFEDSSFNKVIDPEYS